jgi:hypothetical protein
LSRQNTRLLERLADREITVVDPPDTAAIIKETVQGVATILNGWRQNPVSQQPEPAISMDAQGLTADAGVALDIESFVPPWENMPRSGGWYNGAGDPNRKFVAGDGVTVPPQGGVE